MRFQQKNYQADDDESVLDCLLRHQVDVAYSCKTGSCHSCLLKSEQGQIEPGAQLGLKITAIEQQFFLACQQKAQQIDEASYIAPSLLYTQAKLIEKQHLAKDICQLFLKQLETKAEPIKYRAGQFINLKNPAGVVRSYSIASVPDDKYLELHIHRKNNGEMSQWIIDQFSPGDIIDIQGPIGNCFYCTDNVEADIAMIGTGTGAAPLLGIVRDALQQGHLGKIDFYHGARNFDSLYLHDILEKLAENYQNFYYHPSLSSELDETSIPSEIKRGHCNEIALSEMNYNGDTLLYLCGNPWMVKQTKTKAFLAGIASKNIFIDPFEYKELRDKPRSD